MLTYPKLDTVYVRDVLTHHIPKYVPERSLRRPEFSIPSRWLVTEKIDGTNVRVRFTPTRPAEDGDGPGGAIASVMHVGFSGRTDAAQVPLFLLDELQRMFPPERFDEVFEDVHGVILFGEGYGACIQKGGGNYRAGVSFRLFDALVNDGERNWWLNWNNVEDVARKLGIETVPVVAREASLGQAIRLVEEGLGSAVAYQESGRSDINAEGIVARTEPLLFDRRLHRLMWKLKERDFS